MAFSSLYHKVKKYLLQTTKWIPISLLVIWLTIWCYSILSTDSRFAFSATIYSNLVELDFATSTGVFKLGFYYQARESDESEELLDFYIEEIDWGIPDFDDWEKAFHITSNRYLNDSIFIYYDELDFYGRCLRFNTWPEYYFNTYDKSMYGFNLWFPFWIPASAALFLFLGQYFIFGLPWKRRFKPHQCQACGYDLSGNQEADQCPECGKIKKGC